MCEGRLWADYGWSQVKFNYMVKALNPTMVPEGMILYLLIFGTLPTFPTGANNTEEQAKRVELIILSRQEM